MKKLKKFLLSILVIILIAGISIGTFVGNLLYNVVISANSPKNAIYTDYHIKAPMIMKTG